jgi:hypothetical protein
MNGVMELICAICNNVRDSTKQGLTFQKLLNCLRRQFKMHDIDVKIISRRDNTLNEDVFYVNGFYDPEDDRNHDCPIELNLTHNFVKNHIWYPEHSTHLLIQIYDTVTHELRHQKQYRARNFKIGLARGPGHKEYLEDPDEIDAYSISISFELVRSLGRSRALRYLHNFNALSKLKQKGTYVSPCFSMYTQEFPEQDNPTLKKLAKKIYTRLEKVDTDCIFQ